MSKFSKSWNKTIQPRKQRKYRYNIPMHMKGRLLNVHLSPTLRKKYGLRSARVKKGDTVKILRGSKKSQIGKVEEIRTSDLKIFVHGVDVTKTDGSKAKFPLSPSNLMITELEANDNKRFKRKGISEEKSETKKEDVVKKTTSSEKEKIPKNTEKKDTKTEGGNKA